MVGLTVSGALLGLLPPIALGRLVDDLVEGGHRRGAFAWVGVIAAAICMEGAAFVLSDGLYARATGRLNRDLRALMFEGVLQRAPGHGEARSGFASRFVSDVETLEQLTVGALDAAALGLFECGSALVVLGRLDPWLVPLSVALMLVIGLSARRTQAPLAEVGYARQEALEEMSRSLAEARSERITVERARRRFRRAAASVTQIENRLRWLEAANRHGASALTALGPVTVVLVAGFQGGLRAGTLLSLYLLAELAFAGAGSLIEVGLDVETVRGAVSRCFELIDVARAAAGSGCEAG